MICSGPEELLAARARSSSEGGPAAKEGKGGGRMGAERGLGAPGTGGRVRGRARARARGRVLGRVRGRVEFRGRGGAEVRGRGEAAAAAAEVRLGDRVYPVTLRYFDAEGDLQEVGTQELCAGRRVALFAVPGAFTPKCAHEHLPGIVQRAAEIRAKGVDTVACVAVNDHFVMRAFGQAVGASEAGVMMLADADGSLARAFGVELDLSHAGLGLRSRRYSMLIDDGVVSRLNLESGGDFTVSDAESILEGL